METTKTQSINRLQVKASLLDAITYLKYKQHLAPNATGAKQRICDAIGVDPKCTTSTYIQSLGCIYADNGLKDEFNQTITRMKVTQFLIS